MNNIFNQVAYLRTSRAFPEESRQLSVELSKAYIDIANVVNARTIGIFPKTRAAVTGNAYFDDKNQKQQSFRQVFTFTTTANIPHPIKFKQITQMGAMYGTYTDGTNWYGLIAATNVAIPGQLTFYLTPDVGTVPGNIVFVPGAGPTPPTLTSGLIVLEWISNV